MTYICSCCFLCSVLMGAGGVGGGRVRWVRVVCNLYRTVIMWNHTQFVEYFVVYTVFMIMSYLCKKCAKFIVMELSLFCQSILHNVRLFNLLVLLIWTFSIKIVWCGIQNTVNKCYKVKYSMGMSMHLEKCLHSDSDVINWYHPRVLLWIFIINSSVLQNLHNSHLSGDITP